MHEASIAEEIVRIVTEHVPDGAVSRVECVTVRVGEFSGVVREALEFAWEMVVCDTPMAEAVLECESVMTRLRCRDCSAETTVDMLPMMCGSCGSMAVDIVDGSDLSVLSITLRDECEGA